MLELKPGSIEARLALAQLLAKAGKFAEAARTAEEGIRIAEGSGQKDFVEELRNDLQRYRASLSKAH